MLIIGCDFHPGFQQVAIFDNTTGMTLSKTGTDGLVHPAFSLSSFLTTAQLAWPWYCAMRCPTCRSR